MKYKLFLTGLTLTSLLTAGALALLLEAGKKITGKNA